jgi:hypothetical protein
MEVRESRPPVLQAGTQAPEPYRANQGASAADRAQVERWFSVTDVTEEERRAARAARAALPRRLVQTGIVQRIA